MKKSIISMIVVLCMAINILTVFGEEALQNNTEYDTINTEILTDENVIYKALQNSSGISLLDDEDNKTAKFDVVFGFDMSSDMYNYDFSGEMSWLDDFKAIEEQVTSDTRFAVITEREGGFTDDLNNRFEHLKNNGYNENGNAVEILDKCLKIFDDNSLNRNKVVVAVTPEIEDVQKLQSKMDELQNYGIAPFVFLLSPNKYDDIEYVYQCSNELELRIALSDLYLSFGEFNNAAACSSNFEERSVEYKSDFRDKHVIFGGIGNGGQALVSVLNMYGCIPLSAKSSNKEYNIVREHSQDVQNFVKANNSSLSQGTVNDLSTTWSDIYNSLDDSLLKNISMPDGSENMKQILEKNLKRRFPVIITNKSESKIITDYNGESFSTIPKAEKEDELNKLENLEGNYKIFDTYEYLIQTASKVKFIQDENEISGTSVKLSIAYPTNYDAKNNVTVKQIPGEDEGISGIMSEPQFGANSVIVNVTAESSETLANDNWVAVAAKTAFSNGIADIYSNNRIYNLKPYKDVKKNEWYIDVLFKATNSGIINGDDNGMFHSSNHVRRCEFVKMVLEAAQIPTDNVQGDIDHWADKYMVKANELGILFWELRNDTEYYDEYINRYETAYIITELFMRKAEYINVPTLLYEYGIDSQGQQKQEWEKVKSEFENENALSKDLWSKASDAFYQMYMNNIFVGNSDGKINPYNELTKAEAAKIIIKPLFELDENLPQILVNFEEGENEGVVTPIEMNGYKYELDDIVFDGNGKRVFEFKIKRGDLYRYLIETTGDTIDGSIKLEVNESGNGIVGTYNGTNKYYAEGEGTYTISISKTGIANVGLHIQAINAPQEVVFDKQEVDSDGKKHYYIFDDHPEFIRQCDILDSSEYEPTSLMHTKKLEPGIYTVFAYHHVAQEGLGSEFTFGMPFKDKIVFFDGVFYNGANNSGDIEIKKIGISHGDNSWGSLFDAWYEYNDGSNINEDVSKTRYIGDSPLFLTDVIDEKININDYNAVNDMGFVWLMMEFEVKKGSIQYANVAYTNESEAKTKFNSDIESKYEVIQTIKGMGNSAQNIIANEMDYIIDDSIGEGVRLPVTVTNQLNGTSKQEIFTTNISPFTTNNRWTTVQSSEISIEYEGKAIDRQTEKVVIPNNGESQSTWYFDTEHSRLTTDKSIPSEMKIGEYAKKDTIKPNEKFNAEWLRRIIALPDRAFSELGGNGNMTNALVQGMNGFGITNEYTIKVRNMSSKTRTFSYVVQGQDFKVSYSKNGNEKDLGIVRIPSWLKHSVEVFKEDIPAGEEAVFKINVTLMTGSNPVLHNAFVIDGNIAETTIHENGSDNSPSYTGKIYTDLNKYVIK